MWPIFAIQSEQQSVQQSVLKEIIRYNRNLTVIQSYI